MFNTVTLIRKKRDGEALTPDEIQYLIREYTNDRLPDYQMSALMMASFLNGLDAEEAEAFTREMLHSGEVLDLGEIPGIKVDKHSTGGVGDKLSLILAPIVAAAGVPVPMISGRGLGHTGGTLDKLESIPGFQVDVSLDRYREILRRQQMVMVGQTEEIAPADKRLYALRDVTATVECIPLIAASIMSKKLAEGIDALVLDVKTGSGAFMTSLDDAKTLAHTLVQIGESFGKRTIAYITRMDEPLGRTIGNWLEMEESIDCLRGDGPEDVMEISHLLAGTMIFLGGKAASVEEGMAVSQEMIQSGRAFEKWVDLVQEQGGDIGVIREPARMGQAPYAREVLAQESGFVASVDGYSLGMASLELGAGRMAKEDRIDMLAGIRIHKKVGDAVEKGEPLFTLYTSGAERKLAADAMNHALPARPSDRQGAAASASTRKEMETDRQRAEEYDQRAEEYEQRAEEYDQRAEEYDQRAEEYFQKAEAWIGRGVNIGSARPERKTSVFMRVDAEGESEF